MLDFGIPLGFPGWRVWAKCGLPVLISIDVDFDAEAQVYIAKSSNVKGLVVEAESLDAIKREVEGVLPDLLQINYPVAGPVRRHTHLLFNTALA